MLKKIWDYLVAHPFLVILSVGFLVYGLAIFNGFVWDDEEQVVGNAAIQSVANIPYFFTQSTFNSGGSATMGGIYYKPLMPIFFTLTHALFGMNAWAFHLVQLLFHIANAYLIYLVLTKFMKKEWAVLASLLYLVHPGNVESVVYIAGLQEVLFMFFGLLAWLIVLKHEKFTNKHWFWFSLALAASIFSKETGILFVITLGLYFLFYRRQNLKTYFMILASLASIYFILRFGVANVGHNYSKIYPIMLATFTERLMNVPIVVFFYLKLIFFPVNLLISQNWLVREISLTQFFLPLFFDAIFGLGLLFVVVKNYGQKQFVHLLFFAALFVIGIGMHSQIVALDMTVSERWLYFPLFAFLAFMFIFIDLKNKYKEAIFAVCLLVLILFGVRTIWRVTDWRDGLALFTADDRGPANNFEYENNLGVYLHRAGRTTESMKHYKRSTELSPKWWTNWNNLGVSYEIQNKSELAKEAYLKSMKNGDYYLAYQNYATLLLKQKKYQEARHFLENNALLKYPYNAQLRQYYQYLLQQK